MGNKAWREKHKALGLCLYCSEPCYRSSKFCKKHSFSNASASARYYEQHKESVKAQVQERRKRLKEEKLETLKQTNAEEL